MLSRARLEVLETLAKMGAVGTLGLIVQAMQPAMLEGGQIRARWEALGFVYKSAAVAPPSFSALLPDPVADGVAVGDTLGGQLLVLVGANLFTAYSVTVGGTAATIVRTTPGAVYALAPAKAAATYDVVVQTLGGTATRLASYRAWNPTLLPGTTWIYDSRLGITQALGRVSQWNDRAGLGINPDQAVAANQPYITATDFGSFEAPAPGLSGVGTSGPGATGPLLDAAKQALATGKTYFWVDKTIDVRVTGGTQGNVPNSLIGDDAAGGWSGNAGYGGQQGDASGGQVSMLNWDDTFGGFERMTWDGAINDGRPHAVMITHSQVNPWPVEAYVNNVRIANGRIAPGLAGVPIVAQATPFSSEYNAAQLGWNALYGGKNADDDFYFGANGCAIINNSVLSVANGTLLYKWAYGTYMFQTYVWTLTSSTVPSTPNDGVGLVFFNGLLYRICGWNGLAHKLVFSSADGGATWVPLPDFPGAAGHSMPVILHTDANGKLWIYVIGGDPASGLTGEIWRTDNPADLAAWELVTATSPTLGRVYYMAQSVGGNLYIVGGQTDQNDASTADSKVFKSTNEGFGWTQLADAPFSGRCLGAFGVLPTGHGIIACGGALDSNILLSTYFNGVWTINPATDAWTMRLADGHLLFPPRRYTGGFTHRGRFFFGSGFGGFNAPVTPAADIRDLQSTLDGTAWDPYHYVPWAQTHADSWAVDETNLVAYHGFGISGGSNFHRFEPYV